MNGSKMKEREPIFTSLGAQTLTAIQEKLQTVVGKSSGYLESLPSVVQARIRALKKLHEKKVELEKEYKTELAILEKKFRELQKPLFDRRNGIVSGEIEPTPEEIKEEKETEKNQNEQTKNEEKKETKEIKNEEPKETKNEETKEIKNEETKNEEEKKEIEEKEEKGIPYFWLTVLQHHEEFEEMINEKDAAALKYLKCLTSYPLNPENPLDPSFVLEFTFNENPFFENTILKKKYYIKEDPVYHEMVYDYVEGTEILWKPKKNLTMKVVTRQQKLGGKGARGRGRGKLPQTRTITSEEPCDSFFNFFKSLGSQDENEMEDDLDQAIETDFELGLIIKDEIIPNAILWFTGEIPSSYADDEDDDNEDEDEEARVEDYNSEEDEDYQPPPPDQQNKPECNQQ
jgi:nucleosome assembly protein 1-like 1